MPRKKKAAEFDKEGYIRIYPSLHETPEKSSVIKRLLILLKRMKKGH
jgi:hypothetical protein